MPLAADNKLLIVTAPLILRGPKKFELEFTVIEFTISASAVRSPSLRVAMDETVSLPFRGVSLLRKTADFSE